MLKILMQAQILKTRKVSIWYMKMVLIPLIRCTDEVVLKLFCLFTMKFINENIHWHGTTKILNSLNRLVHDVPGFAPTIILTMFFCKVNIVSLVDKFPPPKMENLRNMMKTCGCSASS
jgi:hypothetical protein